MLFLIIVVCFGLLISCLNYSFEKNQIVPTVIVAQIPKHANDVSIVFSSFLFDFGSIVSFNDR